MRSTGILIVLAAFAVIFGCGPERTKTVPDELVGTWKTSAPKYADTFIELRKSSIVFGLSEEKVNVRSVVGVERVHEDGTILYTVFYADTEGQEYKLAFYYDPAGGGVMRWKNQKSIAWTKEKR